MAMPDSDKKLSKLETLALQAFPNGGTQKKLSDEAHRLRKAGYKPFIPEKYQSKTDRKRSETKKTRPNPFKGANDVYLTKNKIAVTKTTNTTTKRSHTKTTQTKYYEQNPGNLKQLKSASGGTVRVGGSGNKYAILK